MLFLLGTDIENKSVPSIFGIENSTIEAHRLKPTVENSCLQELRLCSDAVDLFA